MGQGGAWPPRLGLASITEIPDNVNTNEKVHATSQGLVTVSLLLPHRLALSLPQSRKAKRKLPHQPVVSKQLFLRVTQRKVSADGKKVTYTCQR